MFCFVVINSILFKLLGIRSSFATLVMLPSVCTISCLAWAGSRMRSHCHKCYRRLCRDFTVKVFKDASRVIHGAFLKPGIGLWEYKLLRDQSVSSHFCHLGSFNCIIVPFIPTENDVCHWTVKMTFRWLSAFRHERTFLVDGVTRILRNGPCIRSPR